METAGAEGVEREVKAEDWVVEAMAVVEVKVAVAAAAKEEEAVTEEEEKAAAATGKEAVTEEEEQAEGRAKAGRTHPVWV